MESSREIQLFLSGYCSKLSGQNGASFWTFFKKNCDTIRILDDFREQKAIPPDEFNHTPDQLR